MIFDSVGKRISVLHRDFRAYLNHHLKDLGLGQIPILMTLYRKDGQKQEDIAHTLMLDKSTLARSIKKLEQLQYVTRTTDPKDHRAYSIRLTEKAREHRPSIESLLIDWTNILLQGFSPEESSQFFALLKKAADNAHKEVHHD